MFLRLSSFPLSLKPNIMQPNMRIPSPQVPLWIRCWQVNIVIHLGSLIFALIIWISES